MVYLVIDDDKICKTLRKALSKRPRGASNRQQQMEETDMPPAKRRCSSNPLKPPQPKPPPVKANILTSVPAAGPVVNEEAKADLEVDYIVRAVRAVLQEKKKNSKKNMNPLVDEISSLD
ncbi:unnamed protein product [Cylicocyclus nassatus]|uniref:Uncharacterized protein n=1 Tax=Cylicocyclus nassatus TaxID=53992 RepID=A0AA36M6D8_CYLNA|nr:unnamed protein product [Cylicocyclus nassatus]